MRPMHAETPSVVCCKPSDLEGLINKENPNNRSLFTENIMLCLHTQTPLYCIETGNILLNSPVFASDGHLYEEVALLQKYEESNGYSDHSFRNFEPIFNEKIYLPVRISVDRCLYSKLDPRVVLSPGRNKIVNFNNKFQLQSEALVFYGEISGESPKAVLFLEQLMPCCTFSDKIYYYGRLATYSFIQAAHSVASGSNACIAITTYKDIKYAQTSQHLLFEQQFQVDLAQIAPRSYGCTSQQAAAIEVRVCQDQHKIAVNKLAYHAWFADKWLINLFKRYHHSFSWARDVLRDESVQVLQRAHEVTLDPNYPFISTPITSYQPICLSTWRDCIRGSRAKEICPKRSIFSESKSCRQQDYTPNHEAPCK